MVRSILVEAYYVTIQNPVIQSIAIFIFFLALAKLLFIILNKWVLKIAEETPTKLDDLIIKRTEVAFCYIVVLFGLKLSLSSLMLRDSVLQRLLSTVIILILAYISMAVADILIFLWSHKWSRQHKSFHEDVIPLFNNFSNVFILIISFFVVLETWGIRVFPILAGLGVVGVIVGFAMKDSFANIIGGISVVLDKNFKLHDIIKLETGEVGEVLDIGLRSTKIKTFDDDLLIIPNGMLANIKLVNYAKPHTDIRIKCDIGVAYGSDPDKVTKVLLDSLKGLQGIMADYPPEVRFVKMNDFSMDFQLFFFIDDYTQRFKTKTDVMKRIYNNLKKHKILIPFPTRTLYFKKGK